MSFKQSQTAAYFFLAPAMSAIFVFFFLPVIAAFIMSFTDFDIYALGDLGSVRFIWFNNYIKLFDDPLFFTALKNTFYFVKGGHIKERNLTFDRATNRAGRNMAYHS